MPPLRFCLECKNFEDRMEIDGNVVCARGILQESVVLIFRIE